MKKVLFLLFTAIIICPAFIIPPTDYRDTYVGSYFCTSKCQVVGSNITDVTIHSDTITITVTENTRDSILNITVRGRGYQVKLKNGRMFPDPVNSRNQGRFFASDSISFLIPGGLAPGACTFLGKKQ